jgi:hypothetical protein
MARHECNIPWNVMGARFLLIEAIRRYTWAT